MQPAGRIRTHIPAKMDSSIIAASKSNEELIVEVCKERDQLRDEIERLKDELTVTAKEKHQSAELGLQLLDEKEELQRRFDDMELDFKLTKVELDNLAKAFNNSVNIQRKSEFTGIEQEDQYLHETAMREAAFKSQLQELHRELKQVRSELVRLQAEKERLMAENIDVIKKLEISEFEKKTIRTELKDLKLRETLLMTDVNDLEDENISLQKTVSNLKSNQVDYETAKHEVRRLEEELEERRGQVEEYETLKNIAEKQVTISFFLLTVFFGRFERVLTGHSTPTLVPIYLIYISFISSRSPPRQTR